MKETVVVLVNGTLAEVWSVSYSYLTLHITSLLNVDVDKYGVPNNNMSNKISIYKIYLRSSSAGR